MLRDKCAHKKTGSKDEVFGVTHLQHKEVATVQKTMPIMADICIEILNEQTNGNFVISREDIQTEKASNPNASLSVE